MITIKLLSGKQVMARLEDTATTLAIGNAGASHLCSMPQPSCFNTALASSPVTFRTYYCRGLLEYTGQDRSTAPKARALHALLDARQPASMRPGCFDPDMGATGLADGQYSGVPAILSPAKGAVWVQVGVHALWRLAGDDHQCFLEGFLMSVFWRGFYGPT